jgi:hypothetical protein
MALFLLQFVPGRRIRVLALWYFSQFYVKGSVLANFLFFMVDVVLRDCTSKFSILFQYLLVPMTIVTC